MPAHTINLFSKIKGIYLEHGLIRILSKIRYLLLDFLYDLKFNIETNKSVGKDNWANPHPDSLEYVSARYSLLIRAFNELPINYAKSTLLEIGCGKGRAIAIAASHRFKKITAIDYEEKLIAVAKKNVNQMRFKKTDTIFIQHHDATRYTLPDDVNVIYMFNPFVGETLKKVVENIHHSYLIAPRTIHIIYLNEVDFDLLIKNQPWITKIVSLPTIDTVSGSIYVIK